MTFGFWALYLYDWPSPIRFGLAWSLMEKVSDEWGMNITETTYVKEHLGRVRTPRVSALRKMASEMTDLSFSILAISCRDEDATRFSISISNAVNEAHFSAPGLQSGGWPVKYELDHEYLLRNIAPAYGFGTWLPETARASFFGGGIPFGDTGATMRRRLYAFQEVRSTNKGLCAAKLRDVYQINFLNHAHLALAVEGESLRSWIGKRGVGELRQVSPTLCSWTLSPSEVRSARPALLEAGALIVPV